MPIAPKWSLAVAATALLALAPASTARAQVKLEPKWSEAQKLVTDGTSEIRQTISLAGTDIDTQQETVTKLGMTTGKRREDGNLPVIVKIESLKVSITAPGGIAISFDSESPAPKEDEGQFAMVTAAYRALAGSTYTVLIDESGEVSGVEGTEATVDKARNANQQAGEALESQLSSKVISGEFSQELKKYPEEPVNPGATWTRTEKRPLGGGQVLTFDRKYEYVGTLEQDGKTLDKISMTATAVTLTMAADSPSPMRILASDLKVNSAEGTILFDREAGRGVSESEDVNVTGTMTLQVQGMDLDAEIDLTITSKETTKAAK